MHTDNIFEGSPYVNSIDLLHKQSLTEVISSTVFGSQGRPFAEGVVCADNKKRRGLRRRPCQNFQKKWCWLPLFSNERGSSTNVWKILSLLITENTANFVDLLITFNYTLFFFSPPGRGDDRILGWNIILKNVDQNSVNANAIAYRMQDTPFTQNSI